MIQEMEAWILSQIDKIEEFGKHEGLIRKRENEATSLSRDTFWLDSKALALAGTPKAKALESSVAA